MVYQSIWIEQNEKCDVCLGEDDDEGDEIVMCDQCNVAVHQKCYGRDIKDGVPDEN